MRESTKKLTTLSMLSALAYIAVALLRFPIMPGAEFLKYEPKDVIIVIGGFIYGPGAALMISAVVSLVEMLTVSTTGFIGLVMNIISTCSFACTAAAVYKAKHTFKGAVTGLALGVGIMCAAMLLWNYAVTPIYMGVSRDVVAGMLLTVFLPFNIIKGGINAIFTVLLYKPVRRALSKVF